MSKATKSTTTGAAAKAASLVVQMASLAGKSVTQLVADAVAQFDVAGAAFLNAAKAMIALEERGKDSAKLLRAAGVKPSTVQNARYAVRFWHEAVNKKFVTESVFDSLGYLDFYRCCRLADKMGGWKKLHDRGILAQPTEWQCLYEHGMTTEQKAAADKAAASAKANTPAAPAAAPTVTAEAAANLANKVTSEANNSAGSSEPAGEGKAATESPATDTPTESSSDAPTGPEETTSAPTTTAPQAPADAAAPQATVTTIADLEKVLGLAEKAATLIVKGDPSKSEQVMNLIASFGSRVALAVHEIVDQATAPDTETPAAPASEPSTPAPDAPPASEPASTPAPAVEKPAKKRSRKAA